MGHYEKIGCFFTEFFSSRHLLVSLNSMLSEKGSSCEDVPQECLLPSVLFAVVLAGLHSALNSVPV